MNGPIRLNFDTNPDDCNLACPMCEEHSPHSVSRRLRDSGRLAKRRMDPALLRAVFDELRGTRFREAVSSSAGEPLLYPHFEEMIELCARGQIQLHVTTNGTFPRGGARYWARQLVQVGADVKVSLNGATPATQAAVMPGAALDRVADNVRILVAERNARSAEGKPRSRITLKVTFMEANVGELPNLVRLAANLGVDRLRGSHLLSLYAQTESQRLDRSPQSRRRFRKMIEESHRTLQAIEQATGRHLELSNFHPLSERAPSGPCPYLDREAWIAPDGGLRPCCVPLAAQPKLGDLGNVARQGVLAVWNGAKYREFCRTYLNHPECARCAKRGERPVEDREA